MTHVHKSLWRCPKCGERFVTRNIWHACGKYGLEELFSKSEPRVFALYEKFEALVKSLGPVHVIPQKTRVAFQVRVRFVSVMPRKSHLQVGFWFQQPKTNKRFAKIERYAKSAYGHFLKITHDDQFDEEFMGWLREAYAIGQQKHLH